MKETRNAVITSKKLLTLLLVVSMVALSLPTIADSNLNKHSVTATIQFNKETKSSPAPNILSPIWAYSTNGSIHSSPAIGDVDGDGKPEVVIGSDDGRVYCLNGVSGPSKWIYKTRGWVVSSPAIADVDKDGYNEVIVGSNDYNVYCLSSSGQRMWNYTTRGPVISSPVIADLNGDGSLDIVIGSFDNNTYCLNYRGGLEWNCTTGGALSTPAIADLDGDGQLEAVIGSWDRNVYCLNGTGKVQWSHTTGDIIYSSPNVADVDGDGHKEVVIGSCDKNIYCFNETGGLKWNYTTGNAVRSSPTISDSDNDNHMEIIVGSNDYNVYCLTGTGGLKWKFSTGSVVSCRPAIGDVDGDIWKEVVVGTWSGQIFCLDRTAWPIYTYFIGSTNYTGAFILSSPAIADVNSDNKKDIIIGSENHKIYCLSSSMFNDSTGTTGTLVINVYDSSSGNPIEYASVYSTSEPSGQYQLSGQTMFDGSITFSNILVGSYWFEATKADYSTASQFVYVSGNQITTYYFTISVENSFAMPIIAGIAIAVSMAILILRRVIRGSGEDRDIPTYPYEDTSESGRYPYEDTSESERPSEVAEEPDRPILSQQICPYCGATYMRPGASYCWNCGAGLVGEADTSAIQGRKRGLLATVGRCMVCGLDVKKGESLARCPFCGNIAHRTHLLEWLHTRNYCPRCYHHLDDQNLRSK